MRNTDSVFETLIFILFLGVGVRGGNTGEHAEFLTRLQGERSWDPRVIVDVGANHGGWSQNARHLWPDAAILMIEADSQHTKHLEDMAKKIGNADFHIGLMADSEKEVDFFDGESGVFAV